MILIGTHPGYYHVGSLFVGALAAGEQQPPTPPFHYSPTDPAKEEKFTRTTTALVLVTYKELFVWPGLAWPVVMGWRSSTPAGVVGRGPAMRALGPAPKVAPDGIAPESRVEPEALGVGAPVLKVVVANKAGRIGQVLEG